MSSFAELRRQKAIVDSWPAESVGDPDLRFAVIELHRLTDAHLPELLERLETAEKRLHLILSTIYTTHGYLDEDGEIDTAAKFRAIERLARLDWDAEGMSRVV